MVMQRGRYTDFPWNRKIAKRIKREKRQAFVDLCAIIFASMMIGVFGTVVIITYYPLPWW